MATKIGTVLAALAVTLPTAALVGAQRNTGIQSPGWTLEVGSPPTNTNVSGTAGTGRNLNGPSGMFLHEITVYERQNRPCKITAVFFRLSLTGDLRIERDGDDEASLSLENNCDNDPISVVARNFPVMNPRFNPYLDAIVTGIEICQSTNNNNRLKGIRLVATEFYPDSARSVTGNADNQYTTPLIEEQPNCNDNWFGVQACPDGRAATGLVVHDDGNVYTGIALRCSVVSLRQKPRRKIVNRTPMLTTTPDLQVTTTVTGDSAFNNSIDMNTIAAPGPNMALQKLIFGERNNHPCYLEAVFWTDNPSEDTQSVVFDGCTGNASDLRTVEIVSSNDVMQLASGILICTPNQNSRMKGIRLYGSRLDPNGETVRDTAITDVEDRPNCNEWELPAVHCRSGGLITGLRIFFDPRGPRQPADIIGLQPTCSWAEHR